MMTQCLVAAMLLGGAQVPTDPATEKNADSGSAAKRVQFLVESLQRRLPLDRPLEAPLKEIIDHLEDIGSLPGNEADPLLRLKIVPNDAAFKLVKGDTFDVAEVAMRLPKLPRATLESVLEILCEQLGATIVVRRDHVELIPVTRHFGRDLRPGETAFLVNHFAVRQPLGEVLDRLAERYGRTVVLDSKAADKASELVNAKLLNVPFESAIELLADLSDLKVVCKGQALLVTTPERAKALREEPTTPSRATLKGEKTLPKDPRPEPRSNDPVDQQSR